MQDYKQLAIVYVVIDLVLMVKERNLIVSLIVQEIVVRNVVDHGETASIKLV